MKAGEKLQPLTEKLKTFYSSSSGKRRDALVRSSEGFWNLVAYEKEWKQYPEYCDFMAVDSPVYLQKSFETQVYLKHMESHLKKLCDGSKLLDVGCGIGRFSVEIAKCGIEVHLADVSKHALLVARRRLKEHGIKSANYYLAEAENLEFIPSKTFSMVLAMELICYSSRPEKILKCIHRVLEPGGLLLISVENLHGAILGDNRFEPDEVVKALVDNESRIPGYLYVKYYTKRDLTELLKGNGFKVVSIDGCQYTSAGPFDALARKGLEIGNDDALHELERFCTSDPILRRLPRVWFAVARKS